MHKSNPKPGHTTGGSGRAAHSGAAAHGGPGRMGRRRVSPRWAQSFFVSFKASNTTVLNVFSEARTSEILCKPADEQNPRLTRGFYSRFISETRSALCSWLLASGLLVTGSTYVYLCKICLCKVCPRMIIYFQL